MNGLEAFDQASLLALLCRDAQKQAEFGDKYLLVRELEMFSLRYNECKCEHHSCGGCRQMFEMGSRIRGALPGDLDPARVELERRRARDIWLEDKRAQGVKLAIILERCNALREAREMAERVREPRAHQLPTASWTEGAER